MSEDLFDDPEQLDVEDDDRDPSDACICEFDTEGGCGGMGTVKCSGCGGDQCVCGACGGNGETDCPGCGLCEDSGVDLE